MAKTKVKPPKSAQELRYMLCEVLAEMRNNDIEIFEGVAMAKVSDVILKTVSVEQAQMQLQRQVREIDFVSEKQKSIEIGEPVKGKLIDEIIK